MIFERLDAEGRLLRLDVQPWADPSARPPVDWGALFSAAGLDPGRFLPATPESVPPMSSDARLAWTGTYAENRMEHVRVEAASWQRRPVFFEVQPFPVMTGARVESAPVYRDGGFWGCSSWRASRRPLRLGEICGKAAAIEGARP